MVHSHIIERFLHQVWCTQVRLILRFKLKRIATQWLIQEVPIYF